MFWYAVAMALGTLNRESVGLFFLFMALMHFEGPHFSIIISSSLERFEISSGTNVTPVDHSLSSSSSLPPRTPPTPPPLTAAALASPDSVCRNDRELRGRKVK